MVRHTSPHSQHQLDDDQLTLAQSLQCNGMTVGQRFAIRNGIDRLKVRTIRELRALSLKDIVHRIDSQTSRWDAYCIRRVLRLAGRTEDFSLKPPQQQTEHGPVWLTRREKAWMQEHADLSRAFLGLKSAFTAWLVHLHGATQRSQQDIPTMAMTVCRQLPRLSWADLRRVTQAEWVNAIGNVTAESLEHKNSLVSKRRMSRGPKSAASEPGYEASRSYTAATVKLHKHLALPENCTPSHSAVWRTFQQRPLPATLRGDLAPVHDVLTTRRLSEGD